MEKYNFSFHLHVLVSIHNPLTIFSSELPKARTFTGHLLKTCQTRPTAKKFNEYSKKGLILIDVDAYISKGKTLYAMVWEENTDKLGWFSFRNMSPKNYYKKKVEM